MTKKNVKPKLDLYPYFDMDTENVVNHPKYLKICLNNQTNLGQEHVPDFQCI